MSYRLAIWLALGIASCSLPVQSQQNPGNVAFPLEQHENTTESESALIALSKAHPTNPEPFARLGLLEARRGNYPQAIIFYRKAMALKPAMPGLRLNLGLALFKDGQYKQAIQIFTPMLRSQPPSSPEVQRLTILLGMSHYGLGEYQAAVPYLQQAADRERAESSSALDFGAQLSVVETVSMRSGCLSPDGYTEHRISRGRHAGRRSVR